MKTKPNLPLETRKRLSVAAMTMNQPIVFVQPTPKPLFSPPRAEQAVKPSEESRLRAELEKATKERDALMKRVWANERIDKVTIRICDNREIWKAKMGIKAQPRVVAIMPEKVVVADVFTLPEQE